MTSFKTVFSLILILIVVVVAVAIYAGFPLGKVGSKYSGLALLKWGFGCPGDVGEGVDNQTFLAAIYQGAKYAWKTYKPCVVNGTVALGAGGVSSAITPNEISNEVQFGTGDGHGLFDTPADDCFLPMWDADDYLASTGTGPATKQNFANDKALVFSRYDGIAAASGSSGSGCQGRGIVVDALVWLGANIMSAGQASYDTLFLFPNISFFCFAPFPYMNAEYYGANGKNYGVCTGNFSLPINPYNLWEGKYGLLSQGTINALANYQPKVWGPRKYIKLDDATLGGLKQAVVTCWKNATVTGGTTKLLSCGFIYGVLPDETKTFSEFAASFGSNSLCTGTTCLTPTSTESNCVFAYYGLASLAGGLSGKSCFVFIQDGYMIDPKYTTVPSTLPSDCVCSSTTCDTRTDSKTSLMWPLSGTLTSATSGCAAGQYICCSTGGSWYNPQAFIKNGFYTVEPLYYAGHIIFKVTKGPAEKICYLSNALWSMTYCGQFKTTDCNIGPEAGNYYRSAASCSDKGCESGSCCPEKMCYYINGEWWVTADNARCAPCPAGTGCVACASVVGPPSPTCITAPPTFDAACTWRFGDCAYNPNNAVKCTKGCVAGVCT